MKESYKLEGFAEECETKWTNKKGLMKRWDGLNINTLNRFLSEMRASRKFSDYVVNPTHKLVYINVDGFEEFMKWKRLN